MENACGRLKVQRINPHAHADVVQLPTWLKQTREIFVIRYGFSRDYMHSWFNILGLSRANLGFNAYCRLAEAFACEFEIRNENSKNGSACTSQFLTVLSAQISFGCLAWQVCATYCPQAEPGSKSNAARTVYNIIHQKLRYIVYPNLQLLVYCANTTGPDVWMLCYLNWQIEIIRVLNFVREVALESRRWWARTLMRKLACADMLSMRAQRRRLRYSACAE